MIVPVAVACSAFEAVCPCAHLDVKAVEDSFLIVAASAPIADYDTVKAPFALEDVHKELLVVAVELAVIEVV